MGKLLVAIAVGIVFIVLCLGLYTLWRGGDTARTWSNKLMRIRVLAQAIAIVIIMAVLYFSQRLTKNLKLIYKPPQNRKNRPQKRTTWPRHCETKTAKRTPWTHRRAR